MAQVEVVSVRRGSRRIPVYAQDSVQSPPVVRWRGRVAAGTFPTFFSHLWRFLAHMEKNPEEAVEWAKKAEDRYEILDAIQTYVQGLSPELRYKTKFNVYQAVRSFFQHNRIMLPQDPTFQIRSDTPTVTHKLTLQAPNLSWSWRSIQGRRLNGVGLVARHTRNGQLLYPRISFANS